MYLKMKLNRAVLKGGFQAYISYKIEGRIVYYDLYHTDDYDETTFTPKKDCKLFRLHSNHTGAWPIVSINLDKNIVYFLKDYNDDEEKSDWETRGYKIRFKLDIVSV